jgi:hypothetical protein
LETLAQQYAAEEIGPLYLNINSRKTPVRSPEEISKTLSRALDSNLPQSFTNFARSYIPLLSSLSLNIGLATISIESSLSKVFRTDGEKLELMIERFNKLLTAFGPLPTKPVIVIGTVQSYSENKQP